MIIRTTTIITGLLALAAVPVSETASAASVLRNGDRAIIIVGGNPNFNSQVKVKVKRLKPGEAQSLNPQPLPPRLGR
jgi:hypothetical protein